jgi:hypothetical protein
MFAASYGWFGQTRLYVVPEKAEVNAETFFKRILTPMMLEHVSVSFDTTKSIAPNLESA